jgi:hypothetical protein
MSLALPYTPVQIRTALLGAYDEYEFKIFCFDHFPQAATDVCNGLTGQAHLGRLMTIRKFIIHNSFLCSSRAVAARLLWLFD